MKSKTKAFAILFTGIALAIGVAVSSGIIRNSFKVDEIKAADATTIVTFPKASSDASTSFNTSTISTESNSLKDATNGSFVTTNDTVDRVYAGKEGFKFGSKSDKGLWKFTVAEVVTKIKVNLTQYGTNATSYKLTSSDDLKTSSGTINSASATIEISSCSSDQFQIESTASEWRFYVSSIEFTHQSAKTLESLSASGTLEKTSYYAGESFDPTGLTITANYSDSSTANVTSECSFSPNPLTVGLTSVTASYTEGEITKTVSINGFTVSTRSVTAISVLTNPTKMSYNIGQSFNPTGMKIRATYDLGPTNDDYIAYSFSPTAVFNSLGEKTITITSTENASASTQLVVIVVDSPEGEYGITSGATAYQNPMNPASLIIDKSNVDLPNLVFADINNVRLFGSPITGSIMIGSGSTLGGSFVINLDSSLYVSKIELLGNDKDTYAAGTATLSIDNEIVNFADINTEDSLVFKPYSNSIAIATSARLWVEEIVITAHTVASAALDYGSHFLATTDAECSTANVSQDTWDYLQGLYVNADESVQTLIKAAVANESGSDLENAIARYTNIVQKYGYEDYMGLGIVAGSNQFNIVNNNKGNIALIIIISILGISVLTSYRLVYIRKKD